MTNEQPNNMDLKMKGISLKDARDIKCQCGSQIFMPGYMFKKFSKLLTGAQKDSLVPIELYLCTGCGKPLDELLPEELKGKSLTQEKKSLIQDPNE
jgi:DNA-directed RNA polymerase subunit RPC12/RpoP